MWASRRKRRRRNLAMAIALGTILGIFGYITWRAVGPSFESPPDGSVPLIIADDSPTRVRPDDPGGLTLPHQDSPVYDQIDREPPATVVEQLLPLPEEPLSEAMPRETPPSIAEPPSPPEAPAAASVPVPAIEPQPAVDMAETPNLPAPVAPPPSVDDMIDSLAASEPPAAVEPHAPDTQDDAAALGALAPAAGGPAVAAAYNVQLGSYRQAARAESAWLDIASAAPELLLSLAPEVTTIDLGPERGIYYRLLAGPLPDYDSAEALCETLVDKNLDCMVVAPRQ